MTTNRWSPTLFVVLLMILVVVEPALASQEEQRELLLSGQVKTGQSSTPENRPVAAARLQAIY